MTISILQPEAVDGQRAFFIGRSESNYALGQVLPTYTMMHGARNLLSASTSFPGGVGLQTLLDQIEGLAFANQGTIATSAWQVENMVSYVSFDGVDDRFSASGGANGAIYSNAISMIAWVRFHVDTLGVKATVISKWREAGNLRSFILRKNASDTIDFIISDDGTNEFIVTTDLTIVDTQWYFIGARFEASNEIEVVISNPTTNKLESNTNVTSIPATLFNTSTPPLLIGAEDIATNFFKGDGSLWWLSGKTTPKAQMQNAYQIARPLLGYT